MRQLRSWLVALTVLLAIGLAVPEAQGRFWVLVNGALRFTGIVQIQGPLSVTLGSAPTALMRIGGVLNSQFAAVSNGTTVETDLLTYTLPASALATNGQGVRITAWGTTAANGNSKSVRLYFGATAVTVQVGIVASATPWYHSAVVLRASATTQTAGSVSFIVGNVGAPLTTTPGETLSGAVVLKVTGTSAVAGGDITSAGFLVEALP
jgi:hypothetical protein